MQSRVKLNEKNKHSINSHSQQANITGFFLSNSLVALKMGHGYQNMVLINIYSSINVIMQVFKELA